MSLYHPTVVKSFLNAIATAIAATASMIAAKAPFGGTVSAVTYVPVTGITGANTNTRKLELINKGQAGAGTTVVASLQFDSGVNSTSFDEKTITLSAVAGATTVVAGDVLVWVSTAVGTGIADAGGLVTVSFDRE